MEDLYDEAETAGGAAAPGASETKAGSSETALLPKSLCPGMKVGSTITLTITADHGEEYEVSYNKEPEGDEPEAGEAEPEPSDPMME
jgi:hypothetical protein